MSKSTRKGRLVSPPRPLQRPVRAMPDPEYIVWILHVSRSMSDQRIAHMRRYVYEQTGIKPLVLNGFMQLEVVGQTYHRTSDHLPPMGHHVLIWIGDVWDIAYREERGDTWRWCIIGVDPEGIDFPVDYWAYLPNPPVIEVETIQSTSGRKTHERISVDIMFPDNLAKRRK